MVLSPTVIILSSSLQILIISLSQQKGYQRESVKSIKSLNPNSSFEFTLVISFQLFPVLSLSHIFPVNSVYQRLNSPPNDNSIILNSGWIDNVQSEVTP